MRPARAAALVTLLPAALYVLVRGPLHAVTFALPVSNDDAILLLMGRAVLQGELSTILWNQPYNGALDAYLLAPLLALLPHHGAYRFYQLACAALLVLLAAGLARRLGGEAAGRSAALLAAVGTPYMALMTATGPPPNFLMPLLTGWPLLAALAPGSLTLPAVALLGLVSGLAVWNSSLAIPALAGIALGLAVSGWRPRAAAAIVFAASAGAGMLPLVVAHAIGASGSKVVTAASAVTALRPPWLWSEGCATLGDALLGLLGLQVPLVVDGLERSPLPLPFVLLLGAGLLTAFGAGLRGRAALPLLGWALSLAGAFWLSRRTGADDLRYLYGLNVPLLVVAALGVARAWSWRRPAGVALGLALVLPWAWGDLVLVQHWRDPQHAVRVWQVPSIDLPTARLGQLRIRSAYASLQFAARLALETRGEVVASQAWNERVPGDPLRFRDEVDLDPAPAWVLSERISRGMPRAGGLREWIRRSGGSAREADAGGFVVFHGFQPPYDESRPVPAAALALQTMDGIALGPQVLDRDPQSGWRARQPLSRGSGLVWRVQPARRLSALVALVSLDESPLAVPWVASVAGEVVAEGPRRAGLQWVNGAPRAGKQALLVVPLGDRSAEEVQLVFQGTGPSLVVLEAFAYGPDEPRVPEEGASAAGRALEAARAGRWPEAVAAYAEAVRREPGRASHHACWMRARWRAAVRRWLDVESLDDGGPDLVDVR